MITLHAREKKKINNTQLVVRVFVASTFVRRCQLFVRAGHVRIYDESKTCLLNKNSKTKREIEHYTQHYTHPIQCMETYLLCHIL